MVVREWSEMTRGGGGGDGEAVAAVAVVDPQAVVAVKKKSSRSWVLLDATGQATVLDVDKYAIMHRVHIHARDLRIVDPLLSYPSAILGRDRAIVLNLEVLLLIFDLVLFLDFGIFVVDFECLVYILGLFDLQHIKAIITAEEVSTFFLN